MKEQNIADATNETNESETASDAKYFYDATATQKWGYDLPYGGEDETRTFYFKPIEDERYAKFLASQKLIVKDQDDFDFDSRTASIALWDEIVERVEGCEKESVDAEIEKIPSLNNFLAVEILKISKEGENSAIETDAYQDGEIVTQRHILKPKTHQHSQSYSAILKKSFRKEKIGGLKNRKARQVIVLQDKAKSELYDEMFVSQEGFVDGVIPMRFKSAVIDGIFASVAQAAKK